VSSPASQAHRRRAARFALTSNGGLAVAAALLGLVAIAASVFVVAPAIRAGNGPAASGEVAAGVLATPSPTPTASPTPGPTDSPTPIPTLIGKTDPSKLTGYVWPLAAGRVSLPFGPSSWGDFFLNGVRIHDGVDMTTACGDKVLATHDGVVLAAGRRYDDFVGWVGDITPYYNWLDSHGYWNSLPITVIIDNGDGYRSIYAHESKVTVTVGQRVKAGQQIGVEGQTGNASGCHVHFGLYSLYETDTFALDPAIAAKDSLPAAEWARVDPLLVLPFRCDIEEMLNLRPVEAQACPGVPKRTATPTPKKTTPSAAPTAAATRTATPTAVPTGTH
jgi:murein DD-endopeptidase MepM/ murein hydrolase activator NlpD